MCRMELTIPASNVVVSGSKIAWVTVPGIVPDTLMFVESKSGPQFSYL